MKVLYSRCESVLSCYKEQANMVLKDKTKFSKEIPKPLRVEDKTDVNYKSCKYCKYSDIINTSLIRNIWIC